jgi:hypothetical protein
MDVRRFIGINQCLCRSVAAGIISKTMMKKQSDKLLHQPADFPPCFGEENQLIPRLALLFEEPCPLASPRGFLSSLSD